MPTTIHMLRMRKNGLRIWNYIELKIDADACTGTGFEVSTDDGHVICHEDNDGKVVLEDYEFSTCEK
jgi:hypothetical protein